MDQINKLSIQTDNNQIYLKSIDLISVEEIETRITKAYAIIKAYNEILDCEVIQFFNRNHWNLLPVSWRDYLTRLDFNQLSEFMDASSKNKICEYKMPEELIKLREDIANLSLKRSKCGYHQFSPIYPEKDTSIANFRCLYEEATKKLPFYKNIISFNRNEAPLSILKYKCKDKKLAEIAIMGDLCFKAAVMQPIDFIVDIGAGLGHLSRCLAYFYNINVVTIEKDEKMVQEALRLDLKFLKILQSKLRDNKVPFSTTVTIKRIACEIHPDIQMQDFLQLIGCRTNTKFALVGLHPCGNLAPTMLRLYKSCKNCKFINIASCCYNKMTIREDDQKLNDDNFIGLPLNPTIIDGIHLSRTELGLALHALETHQERFRNDIPSFRADFYRALVEKFIQNVAPEYADKRRRNVKTSGLSGAKTFKEYISQSIPGIVIDGALESIHEEVEFHRILAFSAVRQMFAPLLETIVLLDRLCYLKDDSSVAYIMQRFDPKVSPRVHVITAFK